MHDSGTVHHPREMPVSATAERKITALRGETVTLAAADDAYLSTSRGCTGGSRLWLPDLRLVFQ
jgi:hypothetical protein